MPLVLTPDVLHRLWPHALPGMVEGVASASAVTLARYGITTRIDLVDFIAECSEETGAMTRVVESGAYSAERAHAVWPGLFPNAAAAVPFVVSERLLFNKTYGGRVGNRRGTDDGYNFRGRGMIQLTGRSWYEKVGVESGLDLVGNPDLVASPAHILECAAAYWKLAGVSRLANAGDFEGEVRRVNGALTNLAERLRWRALCQQVLTPQAIMDGGDEAPPAPPAVGERGSISWVQASLNALGADPPLVLDGLDGRDTRFAVRNFQRKHGLVVDGDAGPKTCAALVKAIAEKANV